MNEFNKLFRFLTVGLINNVINFAVVYICFSFFNWKTSIAGALGFGFGAFISFTLNSKFTFLYSSSYIRAIRKFVFLQLSLLLIFSIVLGLINDFIVNIHLSWFITTSLVFLLNYYFQKYYVFNKS
ncbi:GtrA family protein [Prochlorococcus marinus]|uniref:GtrA family protein n=1 Tax=Prochlorococcus marinus TaxID=1219 RepID=UPI003B27DDD6